MKLFLIIILAGMALFADPGEDLHTAARRGQLAEVKKLLDAGAPLEWKNQYGSTPLFMAVFNRHAEVALLLLEKGANPNVTDTFYKSSLIDGALQKQLTDVVKAMIAKGVKLTGRQLNMTVGMGNAAVLEAALQHKFTPAELEGALKAAITVKKDDMAALLRKAGAPEPKIETVSKETLASYAGEYVSNTIPIPIKILNEDGQLKIQAEGQQAAPLTPDSTTEFSFAPANLKVTFKKDAFTLHQNGQNIEFFRKGMVPPAPPARKVDMAVLNTYTGEYSSADVPLKLDVTAADGLLHVQGTGQPKFTLTAESDTVFTLAAVGARMTFDGTGAITLEQGGRTMKFTKAAK
jgi:hypothetical protein